jgi:hypothetical protein
MSKNEEDTNQGQGRVDDGRGDVGRQEEKIVDGKYRVVRKEEEKFQKNIKDVNEDELHEDFYNVDSI